MIVNGPFTKRARLRVWVSGQKNVDYWCIEIPCTLWIHEWHQLVRRLSVMRWKPMVSVLTVAEKKGVQAMGVHNMQQVALGAHSAIPVSILMRDRNKSVTESTQEVSGFLLFVPFACSRWLLSQTLVFQNFTFSICNKHRIL